MRGCYFDQSLGFYIHTYPIDYYSNPVVCRCGEKKVPRDPEKMFNFAYIRARVLGKGDRNVPEGS